MLFRSAPILLRYAFVEYLSKGFNSTVASLCIITTGLTIICGLVIEEAKRQLGKTAFSVIAVKSVDTEIVGFVLVYLLPLINSTGLSVNFPVLLFVLALFLIVVWTTNAYHFNPLLGLFGFHFYEVTSSACVLGHAC